MKKSTIFVIMSLLPLYAFVSYGLYYNFSYSYSLPYAIRYLDHSPKTITAIQNTLNVRWSVTTLNDHCNTQTVRYIKNIKTGKTISGLETAVERIPSSSYPDTIEQTNRIKIPYNLQNGEYEYYAILKTSCSILNNIWGKYEYDTREVKDVKFTIDRSINSR